MAPVDMALMESGSDNQSEQPSNIRMSRVVPAVLVLLGLVGTAFMLGRGSVTSLAAPTEAVRLPIGPSFVGVDGLGIGDSFSLATRGKKEAEMLGICAAFKANANYQNLADQVWLACRPRCRVVGGWVPKKDEISTQTASITHMTGLSKPLKCPTKPNTQYTGATPAIVAQAVQPPGVPPLSTPVFDQDYQEKTSGLCPEGIRLVCAEYKKTCDPADLDVINLRPRCLAR
jgi:hypothetical protein